MTNLNALNNDQFFRNTSTNNKKMSFSPANYSPVEKSIKTFQQMKKKKASLIPL